MAWYWWLLIIVYVIGIGFTFYFHVVMAGNVTLPLVLIRSFLWPLYWFTGLLKGQHLPMD